MNDNMPERRKPLRRAALRFQQNSRGEPFVNGIKNFLECPRQALGGRRYLPAQTGALFLGKVSFAVPAPELKAPRCLLFVGAKPDGGSGGEEGLS